MYFNNKPFKTQRTQGDDDLHINVLTMALGYPFYRISLIAT